MFGYLLGVNIVYLYLSRRAPSSARNVERCHGLVRGISTNSYFSAELLSYSTFEQIKDIMPIFIVSVLMGIIVYFSGTVLPDNYFIKLVVQIFIGVVTYIGISRIVKIEELKTVYNLIGLVSNEAKNRLNISIND